MRLLPKVLLELAYTAVVAPFAFLSVWAWKQARDHPGTYFVFPAGNHPVIRLPHLAICLIAAVPAVGIPLLRTYLKRRNAGHVTEELVR